MVAAGEVVLRAAVAADAAAVAALYLRARKQLLPFAPLAHADDAVRGWIAGQLIPAGGTTVATVGGEVVGFVSVARREIGWIDQLYLQPEWIGRGVGRRLLDHARVVLTPPIRLYTFQANERARRFYERHGFRPVAVSDGAGNEERCPDVLYEWP
jgi:GNAT superfamily N-acetyltransferase